jgi:hypothetical protein
MLNSVVGKIAPDVSKGHSTFFFKASSVVFKCPYLPKNNIR